VEEKIINLKSKSSYYLFTWKKFLLRLIEIESKNPILNLEKFI